MLVTSFIEHPRPNFLHPFLLGGTPGLCLWIGVGAPIMTVTSMANSTNAKNVFMMDVLVRC